MMYVHPTHRIIILKKLKLSLSYLNKCRNMNYIESINKEIICKSLKNCNKEGVTVGIVGGGMTPIYTALLLKQLKNIKAINIVDTSDYLSGAAFDANHIDTSPKIRCYKKSAMNEALEKVNVIALMNKDEIKILNNEPKNQFTLSANYVREISEKLVMICPSAIVADFVDPVTATLPIITEIFRQYGRWDPKKLIGSVALGKMRIEALAANLFDLNPSFLSIPIIGGADSTTMVPLITKAQSLSHIDWDHEKLLIRQLKSVDRELEESSENFKFPAMSSGVSSAKMIALICRGLIGEKNITCSAYIRSNVMPFCRFFTNEIEFGLHGVEKNFGLPKVSPLALDLIDRTIPIINDLCQDVADFLEVNCHQSKSLKKAS